MTGSVAANTSQSAGTRQPLFIGIVYGLTVIATTGIIGGTVLIATRQVLLDNEREYLRASAKTASAIIDGDLVASITRPDQEHSREYAAAVRPLFALGQASTTTPSSMFPR